MWICPICETKNSDNDSICQCCQQPKPKPERPRNPGKWALLAVCAAALALVIAGVTFFTGREADKPRMAARSLGSEPSEDVIADEKNKCGENAFWTLENGTLTVSGSGAMDNYYQATVWDYDQNNIPAPWFDHRDDIKKVIIEDGITMIGAYAFCGCKGLTSVTIPDSVTEIGELAFRFCESLTDVTIPDSVTEIADGVFFNCSHLTSITIPDSVTKIGAGALQNSGLTSVTIPDSVTEIGNYAFGDCTGLTSISIPASVTKIGAGAFYNCCFLAGDITLPKGVTEIGEEMFGKCFNLTSVTIPASVTEIDAFAFEGCGKMTIYAPAGSYAWRYAMYRGMAPANEPVTNICGENAYWTLHNGTLSISGRGAIDDFGSMSGTGNGPDFMTPWNAHLADIKKVVIEDGITSIGAYAFRGCEGLTGVTIPDSVTEVGAYAFDECYGLTSVTIPDSVKKIGANAFTRCDRLTIDAPAGSYAWRYAAYRGILSNSAKSAANVCGEKAYWTLEKGTLTISGSGAMDDFGVLGVAPVPIDIMTPWDAHLDEIKRVVIENGITSVGGWAFNACENLTGITLPKSVTKIGDEAFRDCKSLTDITIPEGVTKIGVRAFAGCESLTGITIPASVKKIGANAFTRCDRLTIDAPAGSYAQSYAKENGIPFAAA